MAIEITCRNVLNNLIRFKDRLLEAHSQDKNRNKEQARVYTLLLNRKTGDMQFAQRISSLSHHFSSKSKSSIEDWKEIRLVVNGKSNKDLHFEVRNERNDRLQITDLEPLAWRVTEETLQVLQIKATQTKPSSLEILPEEAVLKDLSSIHVSHQEQNIEQLPIWVGAVHRSQAEERLALQPIGTYIIRMCDPIASAMVYQLAQSNRILISAYLATFVEKEDKISDYLVLYTRRGWIVYRDEPRLDQYQTYPTFQALIINTF